MVTGADSTALLSLLAPGILSNGVLCTSTRSHGYLVIFLLLLWTVRVATGQAVQGDTDLQDRPVTEIRLEGVGTADEVFIRNNLRVGIGDPFDLATIEADVARIYSLASFRHVTAEAEPLVDGTVRIIYSMTYSDRIDEIEVRGNKSVELQDILALVHQVEGSTRDDYLIERGRRDIKRLYQQKGYFLTAVTTEIILGAGVRLVYAIVEGPRVRVMDIAFIGNREVSDARLRKEIETRRYLPVFRDGTLDEEIIAVDVAALNEFLKGEGYLDARVDYTVSLNFDTTEARVIYLVDEGRKYMFGQILAEAPGGGADVLSVMTAEQVAVLMDLPSGTPYSRTVLTQRLNLLRRAYNRIGYIDARINSHEVRSGPDPVIDIVLEINEGMLATVGLIRINGNFLTRDRVIRGMLPMQPGRPLDIAQLEEAKRRLMRSRHFGDVRITVVQPTGDAPPEYRDILVEVKERNTTFLGFGAAVGSDSGFFGNFSLSASNFDLTDFPDSIDEMLSLRAFRGGGQNFRMVLRPGEDMFQYLVSLTEPRLLETDYSGTGTFSVLERRYSLYEQERKTSSVGLSRRFGEVWRAGFSLRTEELTLTEIEDNAPTEVFLDAGPDRITGVALDFTRTTLGSFERPGSGSRLKMTFESVGLLGGEYSFLDASTEYTAYWTVAEDMLGRKSVLRLDTRVGNIFAVDDRTPVYERYFLGGSSFRGFDFRTISPKGIEQDTGNPSSEPVGGTWMFFLGGQYEFPLYQDNFTGVVFVDSGTVTDSIGFDEYRISAGFGVRLYIPMFGSIPIAVDFGYPVRKEPTDETQILSFSMELPWG